MLTLPMLVQSKSPVREFNVSNTGCSALFKRFNPVKPGSSALRNSVAKHTGLCAA